MIIMDVRLRIGNPDTRSCFRLFEGVYEPAFERSPVPHTEPGNRPEHFVQGEIARYGRLVHAFKCRPDPPGFAFILESFSFRHAPIIHNPSMGGSIALRGIMARF